MGRWGRGTARPFPRRRDRGTYRNGGRPQVGRACQPRSDPPVRSGSASDPTVRPAAGPWQPAARYAGLSYSQTRMIGDRLTQLRRTHTKGLKFTRPTARSRLAASSGWQRPGSDQPRSSPLIRLRLIPAKWPIAGLAPGPQAQAHHGACQSGSDPPAQLQVTRTVLHTSLTHLLTPFFSVVLSCWGALWGAEYCFLIRLQRSFLTSFTDNLCQGVGHGFND